MPKIEGVARTLKFVTDNFDNEQEPERKEKAIRYATQLGLNQRDVMSYREASANPEDPMAIKQRNAIYGKVSSKLPATEERGIRPVERFNIKNFIDENPALQKKYLDEKGYETRIVNNRVEVRKPEDLTYRVVDPEGFDYEDFALEIGDITTDIAKGIAEGAGMGAKAVGTALAPLSGGASLAATGAISGALSGAAEIARQGAGIAIGVRDKPDYSLIGQEALLGATVGSTLAAAGMGLKKWGKQAADAIAAKVGFRPEAGEIKKAYETIGGNATPAQLVEDKTVRELEDAIIRSQDNQFKMSRDLKQQVMDNIKAANQTARELSETASQRLFDVGIDDIDAGIAATAKNSQTQAQQIINSISGSKQAGIGQLTPVVGEDIQKTIGKKIGDKLTKSTELYDKVEGGLKRKALKPDMTGVKETIAKLRTQLDDKTNAWLDWADSVADRVPSMNELKTMRTMIMDEAEQGTKTIKSAANKIRSSIEETRDTTFSNVILDSIAKAKESADPMAKKTVKYFSDLQTDLIQANKLYREVNTELESIIKRPGTDSVRKLSADKKLKNFMKEAPEAIFEKVAASKDIKKAEWMMQNYPEEYKKVTSAKISKIWLEAAQDDKRLTDVILSKLNAMPDSEKLALLGPNANTKIVKLSDLATKAEDDIKLGEFLRKIYRESNAVQDRTKQFADAFVQKLKSKPKKELETIFGVDGLEKFNALATIDKFKLDMANPSKSSLNWHLWDKDMWASTIAEFKRNRMYKSAVKEPDKVGVMRQKAGDKLQKPRLFGAAEATRSVLTTPDREEK
jgi:hypothetical protein